MFQNNCLKKRWCILGILFVLGLASFLGQKRASATDIQQGIASKILRFHVIANSDTEEDQKLKLKIKDDVVCYMQDLLANCETKEESKEIVLAHTTDMEEIAKNRMKECGVDYPVSVFIDKRFFPIKTYGQFTFPAGEYEAICIEIGEHSGKNWWCVMYPSLCFVDAVHAVVPDDSKKELQTLLSPEEYDAISKGEVKVKYSFKILEILKGVGR